MTSRPYWPNSTEPDCLQIALHGVWKRIIGVTKASEPGKRNATSSLIEPRL